MGRKYTHQTTSASLPPTPSPPDDIFANIPVTVPDYYTANKFGLDQQVINEFAGCIGLAIQALEVK